MLLGLGIKALGQECETMHGVTSFLFQVASEGTFGALMLRSGARF